MPTGCGSDDRPAPSVHHAVGRGIRRKDSRQKPFSASRASSGAAPFSCHSIIKYPTGRAAPRAPGSLQSRTRHLRNPVCRPGSWMRDSAQTRQTRPRTTQTRRGPFRIGAEAGSGRIYPANRAGRCCPCTLEIVQFGAELAGRHTFGVRWIFPARSGVQRQVNARLGDSFWERLERVDGLAAGLAAKNKDVVPRSSRYRAGRRGLGAAGYRCLRRRLPWQ